MFNMQERVHKIIKHLSGAVVAFSGGTDSAVLLRLAASALDGRLLAVTAVGPIYVPGDTERARSLAAAWGILHYEIDLGPLSDPAFRANGPDRCYLCKRALFAALRRIAGESGLPHVLDGTNAEDARAFRPGLAAAAEFGVQSPLREAGLTKDGVRRLARDLGVPDPDRPAESCLCTRIPYGRELTAECLAQVRDGEGLLRNLGFSTVRLRHHGDLARIEVSPGEIGRLLDEALRVRVREGLAALGFRFVTVDLGGYRSGCFD
ncbi:MAG: ATP-dependent sacrificial sulfur transferase LarE [Bacillota bacterium]|nr:ATP-dependent sacrificial sulfur transferase LarE [Bacillota bacterium]